MEADVQALHWTKTVKLDRPPTPVEDLRNTIDPTPFIRSVKRCIIVARNFETQEEYTPQTYPFGLVQNLIKNFLTADLWKPQLRNLTISYKPHIAATWEHLGKRLAVRGRPGTFLTSRNKLPQFYESSENGGSSQYEFESMGDISPFIDLQEQQRVNSNNSTGLLIGRTFPYFHTLLLIDNESTPEIQLLQKAIVFSFGSLVAQAIERHGNGIIGKELSEPECLQAIATNGKRFSFLWYQLNTLDTGNLKEGISNFVHIERPGLLYSKIYKVKGRRRKTIELNEDILRTLLTVLFLS